MTKGRERKRKKVLKISIKRNLVKFNKFPFDCFDKQFKRTITAII